MKQTGEVIHRTPAQLIALAHLVADAAYDRAETGKRRWLVGHPPDSYGSKAYRTELHVLEGSPPKGFVVVNHGLAVALSNGGTFLHRFSGDLCDFERDTEYQTLKRKFGLSVKMLREAEEEAIEP